MNASVMAIIKEMEKDCWFICEKWVPELLSAGFENLPVLVRRSQGRESVLLKDLQNHLKKPMAQGDYLRDVSTWEECVQDVMKGNPRPTIPRKYFR